jgi:hypothetical protein
VGIFGFGNAGHGAGRIKEQVMGENVDLLSFGLFEMGFKSLKKKIKIFGGRI